MSFVDNNSIFVKTGLTIHKISKFQPTDTTVKVNLELYFTYKKKEVLNNFIDFYKSENNDETMKEFEQEFKFPFLISNAISIDTYQNTTNHIKINNDSDIFNNIFCFFNLEDNFLISDLNILYKCSCFK